MHVGQKCLILFYFFIMFLLLFLKIIFLRKGKYAMQNEINVIYLCIMFFLLLSK